MRNVLVVDDERSFLLSLEAGLRQYADRFAIVTAGNGKEAVEVLKRSRVDLVVTDLKMPEMDGFELLAQMSKDHPHIPVMVMTAYSTPAVKSRIEALGPLRVQEKPIHFKHLADSIIAAFSSMDGSYLKGITLPTFLQLIEAERKTCTLKVTSKGASGFLWFRDGQLLDAATASERGERAAHAVLSWEDVVIEINGACKVTTNQIGKSLAHVLMEGMRLADERKRALAAPPRPANDVPASGAHAPASGAHAPANGAQAPANGAQAPAGAAPAAKAAAPAAVALAPPMGAPAGAGDPSPQRTDGKMASIRTILTEFTKLQGVSAVCLVGRDGFLLDSIANRGIDTEMIGAIASSGYGASESMGKQLGKGAMSMSMSEFERGPVMFSPVGEDSLIVVIAEKDANLGMIRMRLKRDVQALAAATQA